MAKIALLLSIIAFLLVAPALQADTQVTNEKALKAQQIASKCQAIIIGDTLWMKGDGDTACFGVVQMTELLHGSIVAPNDIVSIYADDYSIGDGGIIFLKRDYHKIHSAWGKHHMEVEDTTWIEANHYKVIGWLLATKDNIAMVKKLISN